MDRRSWLWRRKSSEKSPGEAESSGSMSSHSDRFSDDQAYSNHLTRSPEVTSKCASSDGEVNDSVKTLKDKLSAALLKISEKEDLAKQHAKVAEEAVSGWEKAEREMFTLKQQLEAATQRNTNLEDRIGHLDGALKECLRQLRQAREDQEQKAREAVAEKTLVWESTKSELESQLLELQSQLQATEVAFSVDRNLNPRLEAAEKENSALKQELRSRAEEIQQRTIERDLSTLAAETASKQHLESMRKVAKLEAECRRLKAVARKASSGNDHRSFTSSSVFAESFTDSQSDSGERLLVVETHNRKMNGMEPNESEPSHSDTWASALIAELDQFKNEKDPGRSLMVPAIEINLMDDFLEMERLAALPETESGSYCAESGASLDQSTGGVGPLKADLEAMINRTAELEEKLEKMEMEKVELAMALNECQNQLNISRNQLKEAEMELVELQTQLAVANEASRAAAGELKDRDSKIELAESRLIAAEADIKGLRFKVASFGEEVQKEREFSGKSVSKCQKLESEILRMKHEVELRNAAKSSEMMKIKQDNELAVAASKFAECQKTIASLGQQLKALATLEDFLTDSDKLSELPKEGLQFPEDGAESRKLYRSDLYMLEIDREASKIITGNSDQVENLRDGASLLSGSQANITSEKNQNGCREFLPQNECESK